LRKGIKYRPDSLTMYMSQELVLIEPGEPPVAQVVTVRTNAGLEGNMEIIRRTQSTPWGH
jgi:hypothetical protein